MLIDRGHVVQVLRQAGRTEEARRAEQVLGVDVDTDRDADLLRDLGIDPDSRAQGGGLALRRGSPSSDAPARDADGPGLDRPGGPHGRPRG